MKRIELKCSCGAGMVLEDSRGIYIRADYKPDEKGRLFVVDFQADAWLDRHQACLTLVTKSTP